MLNGQEYTGEVFQKKLPNGKPFRGGDYNWVEPSGSQDGLIDDNDRMVIGNAMPDVTGGFNSTLTWKISAFLLLSIIHWVVKYIIVVSTIVICLNIPVLLLPRM